MLLCLNTGWSRIRAGKWESYRGKSCCLTLLMKNWCRNWLKLSKRQTKTGNAAALQAESDNATRRAERDVANAYKYSLEKFVGELVPIIDSLELCITSVPEMTKGENSGCDWRRQIDPQNVLYLTREIWCEASKSWSISRLILNLSRPISMQSR